MTLHPVSHLSCDSPASTINEAALCWEQLASQEGDPHVKQVYLVHSIKQTLCGQKRSPVIKGFSHCIYRSIMRFIYICMCITHRHYMNTQRSQIRLTQAILVIFGFQVPNFAFFMVFKCRAFCLCVYIKTIQNTNQCLQKTSSTLYIIFRHSLFECLSGLQ